MKDTRLDGMVQAPTLPAVVEKSFLKPNTCVPQSARTVKFSTVPSALIGGQPDATLASQIPPIAARMSDVTVGSLTTASIVYDALGFHSNLLGGELIAVRLPFHS